MAKILVIDDEQPIRALLRTALEQAGHEVVEASDGRGGIALYREKPADLVITDIFMPELNGLDMMLALVKEFLNVKVIAVSGQDQERLSTAKLLGARQILQKPFDMQKLLQAVRYELDH